MDMEVFLKPWGVLPVIIQVMGIQSVMDDHDFVLKRMVDYGGTPPYHVRLIFSDKNVKEPGKRFFFFHCVYSMKVWLRISRPPPFPIL